MHLLLAMVEGVERFSPEGWASVIGNLAVLAVVLDTRLKVQQLWAVHLRELGEESKDDN